MCPVYLPPCHLELLLPSYPTLNNRHLGTTMSNLTKFLGILLGWLVCVPGLARTGGDPVTNHLVPPTGQAAYVATPTNDSCQFAVVLTPGTTCVATAGTTIDAGPSLPAISCGGITGTANDDVWYRFTATAANHTVTVDGDAGFDAVVDVRTSCFGMTTIACADDTTSGGTETVVLTALTVGTSYFVRVYGFGALSNTNGTFSICVTMPVPAPNDDCADATPLTQTRECIPVPGNTFGATQSLPPTTCGSFSAAQANDVWYQFTAFASIQVIKVDGASNMDAVVEVRSGSCNGTLITCMNEKGADSTETITLSGLTGGATYLIRVYNSFSSGGDFTICVTPVPPCLSAPIAPTNGQTDICPGTPVTLRWPSEEAATSYNVYVSFLSTILPLKDIVSDTTYTLPGSITATYYWLIVPRNSAGIAQGCPIWSFTVDDNVLPVITCPASVTRSVAPAVCTVAVTFADATATDNCTNPPTIVNLGLASGSQFPVGTTNVTFRATDISGNSATCSFAVTVVDTRVPIIQCPGSLILPTEPDLCSAVVAFNDATATDNCTNPPAITNLGPASGSSFPLGTTNVTFRATDASGNTRTCSFAVTITDMQVPTITCPAAMTLSTTPGLCSAVGTFADATATDNCTVSPAIINLGLASGSSFPVGTTNVIFRATDASNNSATCSFAVTVIDTRVPTITCPAALTLTAAPGTCSAVTTFADATATDNCTNSPTIFNLGQASGSSFPVGTTNVTFRATDASNNSATCSFAVVVNDTQVPTITCPAAMTLPTMPGFCSAVATFADATATDNCTNSPTIFNLGQASGSSFPVGTTNVIFRATDASNNSATCSFTVVVNDTQVPTITCPATVTLSAPTGLCSAVATFPNATAMDNCTALPAVVSLGPPSGSTFPVGTTNVIFRATDAAGNSATCSFSVVVNDTQLPIIQCPASLTLPAAPGVCTAVALFGDARATDNCTISPAVVNLGQPSGASFPLGTTSVTFRTTDPSGNSATCSFTVIVIDTQVPTITCPTTLNLTATGNMCTAVATFANATATDNCTASPTMANLGQPSGSPFPIGTTNVTFRATDASGNSATCSFAITVNETQVPTITCPAALTLPAAPGECTAVATFANATAIDNCTASPVIVNTGLSSGSTFPVGITNVTFRATDASGNSVTCSFSIIVVDNELPGITCPPARTGLSDQNQCFASTFDLGAPSFLADNCNLSTVTNNAPLLFPVGQTAVVWIATDLAGNSRSCIQLVNIVDGQPPVVTCPENITVENDPGLCTAVVNFAATAADNCGVVSTTYAVAPLSEFNLGTTSVAFTATDARGNTSSCTFLVRVDLGVEICNGFDDDCDGEIDEFDNFSFITKNLALVGSAGDQYGYAVSVQGDYAIIGAPLGRNSNDQQSGAAYLLYRNAGGDNVWGQVAKITAPDGQTGDQFGSSVVLQGDYALVGAPGDDDQGANAGAGYVLFRHQSGPDQWGIVAKLKATDGQADDQFGISVGLDGALAAFGAHQDDDQGQNAGSAYVFRHTDMEAGAWSQTAKLLAADGAAGNNFGISVAVDGLYALVGADGSDAAGLNTGAAYLFHRDAGGAGHWGQVKQLLPGAGGPADNFGHSVALDGAIALIGGHLNDQYGSNAGQAYIFEKNGGGAGTWGETARIHHATANNHFGFSVALDSNFAVIGARQNATLGPNSGSAYVFQRQSNGQWSFVQHLADFLGAPGDQFGRAVAVDGRSIVIGAPTDDNGSRRVDQGSMTVFAAPCAEEGNPVFQPSQRDNMEDASLDNALQLRCYPTPFYDVLNIEVAAASTLNIHVTVVNSLHQEVALLYHGLLEQATQFQWDAARYPAGVYFLRVASEAGVQTRAVVLTPR